MYNLGNRKVSLGNCMFRYGNGSQSLENLKICLNSTENQFKFLFLFKQTVRTGEKVERGFLFGCEIISTLMFCKG